ncbi:hypothetical protein MCRY_21830 [Marivita cryptomonadis]|jgi:hypothetical protein|nr:hypothetical protein MCRY_21830 [Marivita cryptomonadis]
MRLPCRLFSLVICYPDTLCQAIKIGKPLARQAGATSIQDRKFSVFQADLTAEQDAKNVICLQFELCEKFGAQERH